MILIFWKLEEKLLENYAKKFYDFRLDNILARGLVIIDEVSVEMIDF